MKILYVATVSGTMDFFTSIITELTKDGNKVDIACNLKNWPLAPVYNELEVKTFDLSCNRSLSLRDLKLTVKELKDIISGGDYDIVHTHTPIASACARIACRKYRKKGLKVVYTAHGFHFYKGAPIKNWLMYFPIEWLCSFFTDELITINEEDYRFAKKRLHAKKCDLVNGVGIDASAFRRDVVARKDKRKELGLSDNDTVILSVGNLNENKNHLTLIKAVESLDNSNIKLLVAGVGEKEEEYQSYIDRNSLADRVRLIGYRNDMKDLYSCADIYIHPSRREGLSVSAMEACAAGLPVIASNVRGLRDIVDNGKGGILCDPENSAEFAAAIKRLHETPELVETFSKYNIKKAKTYDLSVINGRVFDIYKDIVS